MIHKRFSITTIAVCLTVCFSGSASGQTVLTPSWLTWLGNGTSSYACTSGKCYLSGQNFYTSFTLSAGAVLENNTAGPLMVRATGTCTIAGTIVSSPNGGSPGSPGHGDFGGGGGGGGGGAAAGTGGETTVVVQGIPIVNGGPPGTAGGGNARSGLPVVTGQYRMLLSAGSSFPGGGAIGGQGGSAGGLGGNGGSPVVFVCDTIDFTGVINASGGNGHPSPGNSKGAGGGGGGGYVIMAAETYTAKTGAINVAGGVGGSCNGFTTCGTGGSGGNGFAMYVTIQ